MYTSVAAGFMADRPWHLAKLNDSTGGSSNRGVADRAALLKFLAGRQFAYQARDEDEASDDEENFIEAKMESLNLEEGCRYGGFNGRWNKKADTCYCWWVAGTLAVCSPPLNCLLCFCPILER